MNEDPKPTRTLDCIGLLCPEPLYRTRQQLDQLADGEILEVLADDPAAEGDLTRLAKRTGSEIVRVDRDEDQVRILIRKKG